MTSHATHNFAFGTGEAYDETQCRYGEGINDGDVLVVPSEGVVGIMIKCWPTAITEAHGSFHTIADGDDGDALRAEYAASITIARGIAADLDR